uniref:Uncharacterized protein n=1 Tax=Alexandrium monilatum TaxID=311494 RepID=A0A7S4WF95_9DINO|mmetsp:Transcript_28815/g.90834  ORF Transcript_28815/g.90834 Transcript_28815/m.90834 type:complete len:383 (-) Transcript_28815:42-1190(-)
MSTEGIGRLLAAAATLSDTELAVSLEGLLSRRPAAREVLLSVWRAEEAVATSVPGAAARLPAAVAAAGAAPAAAPASAPQPKFVPAQGPTTRFVAEACGFAARSGSSKLGTEHVLAAAVFTLQEESTRALGGLLYGQLADLLKKSSLDPLPSGERPSGGETLRRDPEAEKLFSVLDGAGPAALLAALQRLPNQAGATQLLEMARIFAQRAAPQQPEGGTEAPTPAAADAEAAAGAGAEGDAGAGAASGGATLASSQPGSTASRILARARCFAAFNSSRTVGTDHLLATGVELFPEAAADALTKPVYEQLVQLLEKSSLEVPPADAPSGENLAIDTDAMELVEGEVGVEGGATELFKALQDLPDAAAAIQLMEMAKIFAVRSG